ncbi:CaiB/BaiF CoA transferase family protein [Jatrophihabitans sp. DSM 45814]
MLGGADVGPLSGFTVISIEQAVAAPFATRQLADLGARVIKIERPDGGDFARGYDGTVGGSSSYFAWLNRAKESMTLDLKTPGARTILNQLLAGADVFVHNLAPGAMSRLGYGRDVLAARYPNVIDCVVSGYGSSGSWHDRKAYDLIVQAEAGLLSITGTPDEPARVGISVADIAAGMYAFSGVLSALLHRLRTKEVKAVEVSLFDSLAEWMSAPMYYAKYSGQQPRRIGAAHSTIAPYGAFATADRLMIVAVQNNREWRTFCECILVRPELADDPRFVDNSARVANRSQLDEIIALRLAGEPATTVAGQLDEAGIAYGMVNPISGLIEHAVLSERGRWVTVESPGGPIAAMLPPTTLTGMEPLMGPVPALGQHTHAVLSGLGYDDDSIASLRADGCV